MNKIILHKIIKHTDEKKKTLREFKNYKEKIIDKFDLEIEYDIRLKFNLKRLRQRPKQIDVLYDLLIERPHNISHVDSEVY
jgi:hypothetical protein